MEPYKCKNCGKTEKNSYGCVKPEDKLCFTCWFWFEKVDAENNGDKKVIRVNGNHYYLGPNKKNDPYKGYGGHRWKIKFFDGREVETNDLWYQGVIPDNFKPLLPDNAEFIYEKE